MSIGIYKITNSKTNDIYVGSSCELEKRKNRHFKDLKAKKHHSIILQRAYDKYKIDSFVFELIETCEKENLIVREQYWLDTLEPKYNICKKAASCAGVKHSQEFKDKQKEISRIRGQKPPESTWKDKQKQAIMIDKVTLKPLKTFVSLAAACRYIGRDVTFVSTIRNCCSNKRHSAYGYRWVHNEEDISKLRDMKPRVGWNKGKKVGNFRKNIFKIKQLSLDNKLIKLWDNVKEAEIAFGTGIRNAARGISNSSKGFRWEYVKQS